MTSTGNVQAPSDLSLAVIQLLKGPLYREGNEKLWDATLQIRSRISDFVATLGLLLEVDESDGYAYLRSRPDDNDIAYPRLIVRHTLPYHVSLLLALLRKRLAEFDATSSDTRLVLTREQIVELLRIYLPESSDEVKLARAVDGYVKRIEELGFLHRLRGDDDRYEVKRILRAFVDGQWLADFDQRLDEYLQRHDGSLGIRRRRPERPADRRHRFGQVDARRCHHHAPPSSQSHLLQQGRRCRRARA
jgi:hypothetical protein